MLKGQLAAAKAELAKLRAENDQLRQEKSDLETKSLQDKNAQRDLSDAKTEIKDLTVQLNATRSHNQSLTQSAETAIATQAELEKAKAQLAENATILADAGPLKEANVSLRQENKELQARIGAMNALLATLREDNARLAESKTTASAGEVTRPSEVIASDGYAPRAMTPTSTKPRRSAPAATAALQTVARPPDPIPATVPSPKEDKEDVRIHVVIAGETLARISSNYYGSADRWQTIYRANAAVLSQQTALHVGQPLRIP